MTISDWAKVAINEDRTVIISCDSWGEFRAGINPHSGLFMGRDCDKHEDWQRFFCDAETLAIDDWIEINK